MVLVLALASVASLPALASAGTDGPVPMKCDRDTTTGSTPRRCVGPVTDESGGGGDALTIVVGVVVGVTVAGVAFVLVRRQLAKPPASRAGPPRPRTPS